MNVPARRYPRQTMKTVIHLNSDDLTFSFRALEAEIRGEIEAHVAGTTPAFVANFPAEAGKEVARRAKDRENDRKTLAVTRARLDRFSGEEIAEAYRRVCLEKHPGRQAKCHISFQRTLRLPDDGKVYPLPAGLGQFPMRSIMAYPNSAPKQWLEKGGVILPMYQGEAMWISFGAAIPCALKILSGSVNALTGERDLRELDSHPQNYAVVPDQPWLDGFKVSKGVVRQFVAMPVGSGFSVSEQLARDADAGGLVIEAFPMKAERYFKEFLEDELKNMMGDVLTKLLGAHWHGERFVLCCRAPLTTFCEDVGLGAGGKIQQEIYADEYGVDAWSFEHSSRVCIHTCNSMMWRAATGENPPHPPITAKEYARYDIPWFDFYRDDLTALPETEVLAGVKSIDQISGAKGLAPLDGDAGIDPSLVIQYGNTRRTEEIRAWWRN
jgi:hypothetical protein